VEQARIAWLGVALVAVALATLALTTAAGGQTQTEVPIAWDVAEAGLDGESLQVFVRYGGCVGPPLRPVVEETAASIRISVLGHNDDAAPDAPCTPDIRVGLVRAPLSGPLNGRSIGGRSVTSGLVRPSFVTTPGHTPRVRVPLLVGLNSFEARRALRLRGLRYKLRSSHGHGGRTQIRGQSPGGGRLTTRHGTVRLLVGLP
jgi:hypothetical protein